MLATGLTAIVAVVIGHVCERSFDWIQTGFGLWGWWWVLTGWVLALGIVYLAAVLWR